MTVVLHGWLGCVIMARSVDVEGSWREEGGMETNCSASEFLSGVDVWVKRPQVVNKRLLGAVILAGLEGEEREGGEAGQETQLRVGIASHRLIRQLLPKAKSTVSKREAVTTKHGKPIFKAILDR